MGVESNVALLSGRVEAAVKAVVAENGPSSYGNSIEIMVVVAAVVTPQVTPYFPLFYFTPS